MNSVHPEIATRCRDTDSGLWQAHDRTLRQFRDSAKGRLLFPQYRDQRGGGLRISEQEARFAFVESLSQGSLLYSVEAPTSKLYQFTGLTPKSAETDLALYDFDRQGVCNVEFKAKGVSPSAKDHSSIFKDIQKLLREPVWGLWFHFLESTDNSTIKGLLRVMADEISKVQSKYGGDIDSPGLTIHICVLRQGFSLHRNLEMPAESRLDSRALHEQLRISLSVTRAELRAVEDSNGWELHRRGGSS